MKVVRVARNLLEWQRFDSGEQEPTEAACFIIGGEETLPFILCRVNRHIGKDKTVDYDAEVVVGINIYSKVHLPAQNEQMRVSSAVVYRTCGHPTAEAGMNDIESFVARVLSSLYDFAGLMENTHNARQIADAFNASTQANTE